VIPVAFTIVIALQLFGGVFFATRPGSWDSIRLGMSREEVITVLGTPTVNTVELKGQDSWRRVALFNERTFVVRYDMSRTVEDVLERNYRRRWSSE
jgi:hypothetical protein